MEYFSDLRLSDIEEFLGGCVCGVVRAKTGRNASVSAGWKLPNEGPLVQHACFVYAVHLSLSFFLYCYFLFGEMVVTLSGLVWALNR